MGRETEDPAYWKNFHNHEQTLPNRKALVVPAELPIFGDEASSTSSRLPWTTKQATLVREYHLLLLKMFDKLTRYSTITTLHS